MTEESDKGTSAWVRIVDNLAESVLTESLEELGADLEPGQNVADAARSFRRSLLAAFDGNEYGAAPNQRLEPASGAGPANLAILIRQNCDRPLSVMAREIPHANMEFLTLVGRFPDLTPSGVKARISRELETRLQIPVGETMRVLSSRPQITMAASSAHTPDPDPTDFEQLLKMADLSAKQRRFWLSLE